MSEHTELRMRVGRESGQTLYLQRGVEPSDLDEFVGSVSTPELAAKVASAWNEFWPAPQGVGPSHVEVAQAQERARQELADLDG